MLTQPTLLKRTARPQGERVVSSAAAEAVAALSTLAETPGLTDSVRQEILELRDLAGFQRSLGLLAGRVAGLLNQADVARDLGLEG